ncbi:hypothetical protein [Streptomyces cyaneogriseus]|uniref:hypothetical protein n=1 Tax=Streptomyces cyaneogriseus TaxID=68192 RepID=UPI00069A35A7|nr:hypothetical protein [Streptomyces cyaneogriseus]
MARLQILELPEGIGDDRPPFVLVVDQMPNDEPGFEALRRDLNDGNLAERIGARAVLVFEDTIDIPANDVPINPDSEQFRALTQDEIRKAQAELAQHLNHDA